MESTVKEIYENYRNSFGDNKPESEGMKEELDIFTNALHSVDLEYSTLEIMLDGAISYALECQEFGFITGFKMAVRMMSECS